MSKDIVIGSGAMDRITGFKGIVIGKTEYLAGNRMVCIQPTDLIEGNMVGPVWVDECRVDPWNPPSRTMGFSDAPVTGAAPFKQSDSTGVIHPGNDLH